MHFRRDESQERGIWVDRGMDGRVDGFQVCEPCDEALLARDPRGQRWHEAEDELCPDCRADFLAHALTVDLFGLPRPFNGNIEGRYITNDEWDEEQRPGDPSAFDYLVGGQEDL